MKTYLLKPNVRQAIAKAGETGVAVAYNASAWINDYPAGVPQLMVTRPNGQRVPVTVSVADNLIAGQVPDDLLVNPGMYSYVFAWTGGATQLTSGKCECIVLGSDLAKTWADVKRAPDWAERIFLAAGVIESSFDGAVAIRNEIMDAMHGAEDAQTAAEAAQEAAEDAQEAAEGAQAAAEAVQASIPEDYSELSSDVVNLKSATDVLNQNTFFNRNTFPSIFTHGFYNANNAFVSAKYRVCNRTPVTFDKNYTFNIADGYKIRLTRFDLSTGEPVSNVLKTNTVEVGKLYAYSISIQLAENEPDVADINEFVSKVYITDDTKETISELVQDVENLETSVAGLETGLEAETGNYSGFRAEVVNTKTLNWTNFATRVYPLAWRQGLYKAGDGDYSSATNNFNRYISTGNSVYMPDGSVKSFTATAPTGYTIAAYEYNYSTGYTQRYGELTGDNETNSVTVTPVENCYYKFSVGHFSNNDSANYLTQNFINTIILSETYYVKPNDSKKHLNILLFGNSYFADSWAYVPFMLKKQGITCNIHFYYRGSGSVDRLVAEWEDDTASGYDDFGRSHVRRYAHIDTRYELKWEDVSSSVHYSPKQVIGLVNNDVNIDKLDLIVLGTGSRSQSFTVAPGNGDPRKGAEPYIRQAINLINGEYPKTYNLAWFGSYTSIDGYDGNISAGYPPISPSDMDNRIGVLKSTEAIMGAEPFDMVIPAGAAIFNARTNAALASTDVSSTGNLWCSDKIHLQAGIPNYIANCAVVQSIFDKFFPGLTILNDDTRITDNLITQYNCPFMTYWAGSVLDSTELLYDLGQKAAILACKKPFDITPIYAPTDTTALVWDSEHSDRYWADDLIDTSDIIGS